MLEEVERNRAIFEARMNGETFPGIARKYQISPGTARKIYVRECHRLGILKISRRWKVCDKGLPVKSHQNLFSSKLGVLRRQRKLTLAELAERIGVSKPTVWAWENGRTSPRKDRIAAIAEALSVSENELILNSFGAEPLAPSTVLAEEIAQSKARIAALAGTTVEKVLIAIMA